MGSTSNPAWIRSAPPDPPGLVSFKDPEDAKRFVREVTAWAKEKLNDPKTTRLQAIRIVNFMAAFYYLSSTMSRAQGLVETDSYKGGLPVRALTIQKGDNDPYIWEVAAGVYHREGKGHSKLVDKTVRHIVPDPLFRDAVVQLHKLLGYEPGPNDALLVMPDKEGFRPTTLDDLRKSGGAEAVKSILEKIGHENGSLPPGKEVNNPIHKIRNLVSLLTSKEGIQAVIEGTNKLLDHAFGSKAHKRYSNVSELDVMHVPSIFGAERLNFIKIFEERTWETEKKSGKGKITKERSKKIKAARQAARAQVKATAKRLIKSVTGTSAQAGVANNAQNKAENASEEGQKNCRDKMNQ